MEPNNQLAVFFEPVARHDDDVFGAILNGDVAVRNYLDLVKRHLTGVNATECWINKPGELLIEVGADVVTVAAPELDYQALESLSVAVAVYAKQEITAERPILSATLPDGERIQIVMPPAVEPGIISMSIRIPSATVRSMDQYEADGVFARFGRVFDAGGGISHVDMELKQLLEAGRVREFLSLAIKARKNIGVVGDTGSGKTTLMKSLCQEIDATERLITIEDVRELYLPGHPNRVHLLYSKGGQSVAKVTPADLISSCMRMKPKRVLLAELRGGEAWDFLKLLTTGHSGSITSWHAESAALGFERFMFMAKENTEAASLARSEVIQLLKLTLDVIVHMRADVEPDGNGGQAIARYIDEIYFDPAAKAKAAGRNGAASVATE